LALSEAGDDFYHYWIVPVAVRQLGLRDVYRPAGRAQIGRHFLAAARQFAPRAERAARENAAMYPEAVLPTATPFLYAMHGLASTGDYERDYRLFQAASSLAFVLGMVFLARVAGLAWPAGFALAGLLLWLYAPLHQDVAAANTNRLQVGLLAVALGLLGGLRPMQWTAGGLSLGLAVAYKPNVAPAVLLVLAALGLQRRWRRCELAVVGLVLGAALAFGVGAWFFGSRHVWATWAWQLPTSASMRAIGLDDFAVTSLLAPELGAGRAVQLLTLGFPLALALSVLARAARAGCTELLLPAAGAGLALTAMFGPLVWNHYFVLSLPLFVWLLRPAAGTVARALAALGLALTAGTPLAWFLRDLQPLPAVAVMQSGLLIGLLLAAVQGASSARSEPAG